MTTTRQLIAAFATTLALAACAPAGAPTNATDRPATTTVSAATTADQIDWASLKPGDTVPESAFPAPVATDHPPVATQERRLADRDRIVIPAMRAAIEIVDAPVVNGSVVVPGAHQVGWVTSSSKPGARRGVSVIAGHLTTGPRGANAGPLYGAENLHKGARIRVHWRGKKHVYRVNKVTKHPRYSLPPRLLSPNGKNRVALITCTGPYVLGKDGNYWLSRNAIIWAKRVKK